MAVMQSHRESRHIRYRNLDIWAERGLIHIVDERYPTCDDRAYETMAVEKYYANCQALIVEVMKPARDGSDGIKYADERREKMRYLEQAKWLCKVCWDQGTPSNPQAVAEAMRRKRLTMCLGSLGGAVLLSRGPGRSYDPGLPPIPVCPKSKPFTPLVLPG